MVVTQVPDSSALSGPNESGGTPGSATVSVDMTLGSFRLASAATVVVMFGCTSPAIVHATVAITVNGETVQAQCGAVAVLQRSQMQWTPSDVGRMLTVTASISTDGASPQWNLLVEQPK